LRWHFFDHRPSSTGLDTIRGSLAVGLHSECRPRAPRATPLDATDHVMNSSFRPVGLKPFHDLGRELGRSPRSELLPASSAGVYTFSGRTAEPDAKVGADVLPWWRPPASTC